MNSTARTTHDGPSTWKAPLYTSPPEPSVTENASHQVFSSVVPSNHLRRRPTYEPSRTWSPGQEGLTETFQQNLTPPNFGFGSQQNQRLLSSHQPSAPPPRSPLRVGPSPTRPNVAMNYLPPYGSPYPSSQPYPTQSPAPYIAPPQQYGASAFAYNIAPAKQTHRNLLAQKCRLQVTQNPVDTQAATQGKEKVRKPLDPPPIVELHVDDDMDPTKLYMNTPNLFCMVHLCAIDSDEPYRSPDGEQALLGTLCSSIHRLKNLPDHTGKPAGEGGYFIFGDVSVRIPGTWRLRYTLYDIPFQLAEDGTDGLRSRKLAFAFSKNFKASTGSKDFKGLGESTELTKTFADQGVRLRLRKELRPAKRKGNQRSPSEEIDSADLVADSKRQRFDDFGDHTEFMAGPVQPLNDGTHFNPATLHQLGDMNVYPTGPVQPSALYTMHNPIMTNNLQSRYQERVAEQYNILGGSANAFATYPM